VCSFQSFFLFYQLITRLRFCFAKQTDKAGVMYDAEKSVLPNKHTGVAPIIVDTKSGDNSIIVIPGANHALTPEDVRESLNALASKHSVKVVLVQLEIPLESAQEALKVGKELGATTILNPAPASDKIDDLFAHVDILIPNESELASMSPSSDSEEKRAHYLLNEKGVGMAVVVTLGARGAMVVGKDKTTLVCAPDGLPCASEPVQDTVGAGDSFCGSLSCYLLAGLALPEAATKACGVASMSVRKRGAQTSYPKAHELPPQLRLDNTEQGDELASKETITFVTGNKKKLEEVQKILADGNEIELPFELNNKKLDLPELQGDPLDVAREKCKLASEQVQGPVLTEDTSLCFNALNGLPGPYIKWFLEKCGHDGLNNMLGGFKDKSAYAQTIFALQMSSDDEVLLFEGRTDGKIVPARGSLDFGWDPVFEPLEGGGKTYGEMSKDDKNVISHRGRALAKLKDFLVKGGASKPVDN